MTRKNTVHEGTHKNQAPPRQQRNKEAHPPHASPAAREGEQELREGVEDEGVGEKGGEVGDLEELELGGLGVGEDAEAPGDAQVVGLEVGDEAGG